MTVRAGQWKAPTRFFPAGTSIAVFPPIAASTWATRLVGTAIQEIPRRYVAATNPATSSVEPPPRATRVELRSSRSDRQSRSASATVFAASPGGTRCVAATPCSSATRSSATICIPARRLRVRPNTNAGGGEHGAVEVASTPVGCRVERPTLLEQRAEAVGITSERPLGRRDALPGLVDRRLHDGA